jgi:hypothetical protein
MKTYVVDMNMLQSPELAQSIQGDASIEYVLPDIALVEMCKHPDCLLTMQLALEAFANHSDRVHVTLSVGEALSNEMGSLNVTCRSDILSNKFTEFGRQLITDLSSGNIKSDQEIQKKFGEARGNLLSAELNAEDAKSRTKQYLTLLEKGLHRDVAKAIRSPSLRHERLVAFAYFAAGIFVKNMLQKDAGMSEIDAICYIEKNPLILRFQFLVVRHSLLSLRNGVDMSNMKPEKELNHQLDFDYVLNASYFDGLLSKDKRVNEAYQDLSTVISTPSEELHETVTNWFQELEEANR